MPTDTERREVARRLRERAGKRILNLGELLWCIGCDDGDDAAAWNRLADLIEPDEPKVRCVAEVKVDGERLEKLAYDAAVKLIGVDRDVLLTLVEELETPCCGQLDPYLSDVARRIRDALGVES